MIRELKKFFDEAKAEEQEDVDWKKKTPRYWYRVYQRFLDKREEKMVNFALKRWGISGLRGNVAKVTLDSVSDENKNEIYALHPKK